MSGVWVCKLDGSIQCDESSIVTTLYEDRNLLEKAIGEHHILSMEKRSHKVIQLCGVPTGIVNAYEITEEGWIKLNTGFLGSLGFVLYSDYGTKNVETNLAEMISTLNGYSPKSIRELIGHPLRLYKTGDVITKDWKPERVNVETDDKMIIANVWFG
ncbi:hypothetical protein [Agarivorans sp. JK6]|uniref:hypothetical protein n=1 Tax=Agarivorans sp. JK6 TaxID=2997426 RepID=UPI0038734D5E